jgi:hypothetical protein
MLNAMVTLPELEPGPVVVEPLEAVEELELLHAASRPAATHAASTAVARRAAFGLVER